MAAWTGDAPRTDDEAAAVFDSLQEQYLETGENTPPEEPILSYVQAIVDRYPNVESEVGSGAWSEGALLENASGPIVCFSIPAEVRDVVLESCVSEARANGLNLYDPQDEVLLVSADDGA